MAIDTSYCFRKNEQILLKELAEGPALIDPYRRTLTTLNPTAFEIWQLIDGGHSVAEIIEAVRDSFDAEGEGLKKDVTSFLKDLVKREMIR
jgi:hypothetical protein